MGAVKAGIELIVGFWTIGAVVVYSAPMFEYLRQLSIVFGVQDNPTILFCLNSMNYILMLVGLALILAAIGEAGGKETTGYFN
ncbi:MAG: hypothetical protein ACC612_11445 [Methanomethylovorans sp.]|uniref:hypothetical protein n=1 Tax=Methanomethylovorans sp. TaxID=2758717 RepID=UPI0035314A69